jgi:hypothetical protein
MYTFDLFRSAFITFISIFIILIIIIGVVFIYGTLNADVSMSD